MNNFELNYENDERRIEFMTRAPWLKNKITGQIVYSRDGYPIGDNARDPRWKGYPMSLHFNNGVMNSLPLLTGPTEFICRTAITQCMFLNLRIMTLMYLLMLDF